jgi:hypothetical protein
MGIPVHLDNQEYATSVNLLYDPVVEMNAQHILEIGTRSGNSTRIFLEALKKTGGHITTVDKVSPIWDKDLMKQYEGSYTTIKECSGKLKWDKPIDILYVDGNHSYPWVYGELFKYSCWLLPKGLIILHDTDHNQHADEIRACIHHFCKARKLSPIYHEAPPCGIAYIHVH